MVIDFSRLNSSSSPTGSTRTSAARETAEAGKSAPLESAAEQAGTVTVSYTHLTLPTNREV